MSEVVARHVIISGRVQGVGYRSWAAKQAERLGVVGWVRNRTDRTVEAIFQGTEGQITSLIDQCRSGPLAAKVMDIVITDTDIGEYGSFERRDTI